MPGWEVIGKEEQAAVNEVFEKGGILCAHGFDHLRKGHFATRFFESEFKDRFQAKHATAVSSGTAGLKVALKALGVGVGDEVITQAFNFIATVEAIRDCGATPIMTNIDDSLNMDPTDLKEKITSKTKAIIIVHMLGNSADMDRLMQIANENGIKVIEDNCESPGATWNDKLLGTIGDIGVFSFDMGKMITCGEGGMVITNDEQLGKFCREYPDHGHENNPDFHRGEDTREIYGFNYRMTEMQAAVGRVQLTKFNDILSSTQTKWKSLREQLSTIPSREVFNACTPMGDTVMIKVVDEDKRNEMIKASNELKVGIKNVPSAIKWHCAGYWDHILDENEFNHSQITKQILSQYVAIPINLKVASETYHKLGERILEIWTK